jgi:hypothetical protein
MAQKTAWDGAALTESDINTYLMGEGGAWTSWTPVITQGATPTITNTRSVYARYGRLIVFSADITITSNGTAGNNIVMSLPVASAGAGVMFGGGAGRFVDASASDKQHPFILGLTVSASTFTLIDSTVSGVSTAITLGNASSQFTAAVANGDTIRCSGFYEAAS